MIGLMMAAASLAACGSSNSKLLTGQESSSRESFGLGRTGAITPAEHDAGKAAAKRVARMPDAEASHQSVSELASYRIGPQDTLDLVVFKVPELQRSAVVAETGAVNLPLLGDVQASGRTAAELERDIAQRLGRTYLQSPQVSVIVREFNSQRVTMDGAVRKPGVYALRGRTTLLQVIAMAEGFTDVGDHTVVIFRHDGSRRLAAKFDVTDIRSGASPDPVLRAGDTVVAPTSATKETFANILKAVPLATFAALAL